MSMSDFKKGDGMPAWRNKIMISVAHLGLMSLLLLECRIPGYLMGHTSAINLVQREQRNKRFQFQAVKVVWMVG